jgi:hypothetical protein
MKKELVKKVYENDVYRLLIENWSIDEDGSEKTEMLAAYSSDGGYIGDINWLMNLVGKRGIKPQKISEESNTCSIGFCEEDQKWYGWSHRAIFGFGIGHVSREEDCQTTSGWTEECLLENPHLREEITPVGFECKTLDDCKKVAISFAKSVS